MFNLKYPYKFQDRNAVRCYRHCYPSVCRSTSETFSTCLTFHIPKEKESLWINMGHIWDTYLGHARVYSMAIAHLCRIENLLSVTLPEPVPGNSVLSHSTERQTEGLACVHGTPLSVDLTHPRVPRFPVLGPRWEICLVLAHTVAFTGVFLQLGELYQMQLPPSSNQ